MNVIALQADTGKWNAVLPTLSSWGLPFRRPLYSVPLQSVKSGRRHPQ